MPARFSVPGFDAILAARTSSRRERRAVLALLGLNGASHISSHVDTSSAPAEALIPLTRSRRANQAATVEVVQSYGRGYVIPRVTLDVGGETRSGAVAVKGSGLEAWAVENRDWIIRENGGRGLVPGRVSQENTAGDLWGEYWARNAGLVCPVTVYCARRRHVYQHARLWRCPYRIWELTSGPFRTGPHITQSFAHLNWGVELAFALTYRDRIRERARQCLAPLSARGEGPAVRAMASTLIDNVAKLTTSSVQLSPFTLHLANIAYSGETTGFDRMKGPAAHPDVFQLGVLMALIEAWAALSWLGATTGTPTPGFGRFFRQFQARLGSSGAPRETTRFFLRARDVVRVFSAVNTRGFAVSRDRFLFSRRQTGDIAGFVAACETFFDGLKNALTGEFSNFRQLLQWRERADFARVEQTRIWHSKGGELPSGMFLNLVREHRALDRHYQRLLERRLARRR